MNKPAVAKSGLYEIDERTLRLIVNWRDGLPTPARLAEVLGLKGGEASVRARLKRLEQSGHVERIALGGNGFPKLPRVTYEGRKVLGLVDPEPRTAELRPRSKKPMPMYPVSCGPLAECVAETEYIEHPFTDWKRDDYILYADGDSMWDRRRRQGIERGSKLHMRPVCVAENGDVVHVEMTHENGVHECTLKVFHQDEITGDVLLQAINPDYPDIVLPPAKVLVKGVAQSIVAPMGRFMRTDRK